jgi:RNA-directed DNA polymerase
MFIGIFNIPGFNILRNIEPSSGYLKKVQRKIDRNILKPGMLNMPMNIMGGRKGVSVIQNANFHSRSKALMKYDVKNFFPSIRYEHVYYVFRYRLNFCEEASNILAKLTTYPSQDGHVPQGAPTSTSIAMYALEPMCIKLANFTEQNDLKFSIWVDDITVSGAGTNLKKHRAIIDHIVNTTPYEIHPDKDTGIIKKGSNIGKEKGRNVTGIIIDNTNRLTLGSAKYKSLKRRVKKVKQSNDSLRGSLLFLRQVSPSQGRKLYHDYKTKTKEH